MQQKKFAVIGHPIGHTMSPFIHSRLLELAGAAGSYTKLDIPPAELSARFADTLCKLDGFNVTIPHKQAVLPLLTKVGGDAAAFGSVNTVKVCGRETTGYTTDGIGFTRALAAAGIPLAGQVLLLGCGGVARVMANEILRAPKVTGLTVLMRRHAEETPAAADTAAQLQQKQARRAAREAAFLKGFPQAALSAFSVRCPQGIQITDENSLRQGKQRYALLVNATSAGMYPNLAVSPVEKETAARAGAVFDAVYNPGVPMLIKYAEELGIPAVSGMGMLVWQAAVAEEIWLGCHFQSKDVSPIITEAQQAMRQQFGNVVLCGFMGSGKSTAGHLLAKRMGRTFVDTDRYIEEQEGMPVPALFARYGENWFRARETEACRTLSRKAGLVIATGGGMLANPLNAEILRETCLIVLLRPPYAVLQHRLSGDHSRPMLEKPNRAEVMRALYDQRMPLYQAAADFTVHAEDSRTVSEQIFALLSNP
ncbi:MAG: shikimate kinase [Oscillospiraceae bacterium]|nr:shikimate kinase [Oscillospiraceae bacterium]